MRILSVKWDAQSDDTKIEFSKEFAESDWIVKADVLKDAIGMLQHQYDTLMSKDFATRTEYKLDEKI